MLCIFHLPLQIHSPSTWFMPQETKLHEASSRLPFSLPPSWGLANEEHEQAIRISGRISSGYLFPGVSACRIIIIWLYSFRGGHSSTKEVLSSLSSYLRPKDNTGALRNCILPCSFPILCPHPWKYSFYWVLLKLTSLRMSIVSNTADIFWGLSMPYSEYELIQSSQFIWKHWHSWG